MDAVATSVMDDQTILPENTDSATVTSLLEVLVRNGHRPPEPTAKLVSEDGHEVVLPAALHEALVHAVRALSEGYAITIAPHHTTLTTQQAADMLGISRPTLTKLLDEGKIPYERPNSHRKIKLRDLLEYQQRRRAIRRQVLDELVADTRDAGLDDEFHDAAS